MIVLVAGVNGFMGRHLARALQARSATVIGIGRDETAFDRTLVPEYFSCDLSSAEQVARLEIPNVDTVINVAGLANVGDSFYNPARYLRVNVDVHTLLMDRLLALRRSPKIIAVSTGALYDPRTPMPLTERSPLDAEDRLSPYAVSKKHMEQRVLAYQDKGLPCIIVRPFNHSGPGQRPGFLLPDLADQISKSMAVGQPMKVGDLSTRRDYTDVRDIVKAYADLAGAEHFDHDVYNICSGTSRSGETVLRELLDAFGASSLPTQTDPNKMRRTDITEIYGDFRRIRQETGWEPQRTFTQTIRDFVAWYKEQSS